MPGSLACAPPPPPPPPPPPRLSQKTGIARAHLHAVRFSFVFLSSHWTSRSRPSHPARLFVTYLAMVSPCLPTFDVEVNHFLAAHARSI